MKRNSIFAASSLLLAGMVVGAGAMISGSAMADNGNSADTAEVTVGMANAEGEVMECSLSGIEAEAFFGSLESGNAPEGLHSVFGSTTVGTEAGGSAGEVAAAYEVDITDVLPTENAGDEVVFGVASVDSPVTGSGGDAAVASSALPAGEIVDSYVVRAGTPEECASVLEAVKPGE